MDHHPFGYLYLLHPRKFFLNAQSVFKVGRSDQIVKRMRNYELGSVMLACVAVDDVAFAECALLHRMRRDFVWRRDIGTEYFEGRRPLVLAAFCLMLMELAAEGQLDSERSAAMPVVEDEEEHCNKEGADEKLSIEDVDVVDVPVQSAAASPPVEAPRATTCDPTLLANEYVKSRIPPEGGVVASAELFDSVCAHIATSGCTTRPPCFKAFVDDMKRFFHATEHARHMFDDGPAHALLFPVETGTGVVAMVEDGLPREHEQDVVDLTYEHRFFKEFIQAAVRETVGGGGPPVVRICLRPLFEDFREWARVQGYGERALDSTNAPKFGFKMSKLVWSSKNLVGLRGIAKQRIASGVQYSFEVRTVASEMVSKRWATPEEFQFNERPTAA